MHPANQIGSRMEGDRFLESFFSNLRSSIDKQILGTQQNLIEEWKKFKVNNDRKILGFGLEAKHKIDNLQRENDVLREQVDGLKLGTEILQQQNSYFEDKNSYLLENITSLETEIKSGKRTEEELRQKITQLERKLEEGEQRCIGMEGRLQQRVNALNAIMQLFNSEEDAIPTLNTSGVTGVGLVGGVQSLENNVEVKNGGDEPKLCLAPGSIITDKANRDQLPIPPMPNVENSLEQRTPEKIMPTPDSKGKSSLTQHAVNTPVSSKKKKTENAQTSSTKKRRLTTTTTDLPSQCSGHQQHAANVTQPDVDGDDEVEFILHLKHSDVFIKAKKITEECLCSVNHKRNKALQKLSKEHQLDGVLSCLVALISSEVVVTIKNSRLKVLRLKLILNMLECLLQNPNLNLENYASELAKPLLKLIIEPGIISHAELSQWSFRDDAASLLGRLSRRFKTPVEEESKVFLTRILNNPNAAIGSIYGAIVGLGSLGDELVCSELFPKISEIGKRLESQRNAAGTSRLGGDDESFQFVIDAVGKLVGPLIMSGAPVVGLQEYEAKFGCFGKVLFQFEQTYNGSLNRGETNSTALTIPF